MKSVEELAGELGITCAQMLEHLEELEAEGLAARVVDEVSGRAYWFAAEHLKPRDRVAEAS